MASYATKPMSFSFKKPEGMAEKKETTKKESSEDEAMTPEEMGVAVTNATGSALYEAICNIIDAHLKG